MTEVAVSVGPQVEYVTLSVTVTVVSVPAGQLQVEDVVVIEVELVESALELVLEVMVGATLELVLEMLVGLSLELVLGVLVEATLELVLELDVASTLELVVDVKETDVVVADVVETELWLVDDADVELEVVVGGPMITDRSRSACALSSCGPSGSRRVRPRPKTSC